MNYQGLGRWFIKTVYGAVVQYRTCLNSGKRPGWSGITANLLRHFFENTDKTKRAVPP
jgi:hypothetical protein